MRAAIIGPIYASLLFNIRKVSLGATNYEGVNFDQSWIIKILKWKRKGMARWMIMIHTDRKNQILLVLWTFWDGSLSFRLVTTGL